MARIRRRRRRLTPAERRAALRWIVGHDTGVSSETMWAVMMGVRPSHASPPADPDDFGRCHRLLQRIRPWRHRLDEVARAYPRSEWPRLIRQWNAITQVYLVELKREDGCAPETYELLRAAVSLGRRTA